MKQRALEIKRKRLSLESDERGSYMLYDFNTMFVCQFVFRSSALRSAVWDLSIQCVYDTQGSLIFERIDE